MRLTGVSPVLLCSDMERSIEYFRDRLGFDCTRYGDGFAICERDGMSIFLALTDKPIVPHWQSVDMMWNAYVRVDDVDAFYAEVQRRGAGIDYSLYDAPHGMREFGVQDPDGHDIAFGQRILRWEPVADRVRVRFAGETVVETANAMLLHEIGHRPVYYFPDGDVRAELLRPSDHRTHCPRKGDASYWSLCVGETMQANAAWYYPEPIEPASFLAGHTAFYREHVEIETD